VVQSKAWKGIPNGIVYQKGGWALHMLRTEIGDAAFREGIREYYRRYRNANASTADFRRVMEETSGTDLGWFFDQWLYRAGSPAVEGEWSYDSARHRVALDLRQTQPGTPYRLPLEVAVAEPGAQPRVVKLEFRETQHRFEIESAAEPAAVELDPTTRLLIDARLRKAP
jgi:aminopeptidase N